MHIHNSHLVYNFCKQAIKLFLYVLHVLCDFWFYYFYTETMIEVNLSPLQFRKQVLLRFSSYSQNKFYLYWSYMLDFVLLTLKVCRF